ncbi:type I-F CRISPR-associated helicase Cas3f [Comamonas fluminis]|uniref:type I-F CRISPR-associated helicase Cas3f n=1 Tax=Comamonas fluminis TaxID=2796366 RepID=UPI001C493F8B|nr:type I-F CRISPR-associated helicase Cas3f [Comamonas fluminis]
MNVLFVSQCSKRALTETRRILDQFAERRGERTWQTPITQAGLDTVRKLLRASARKNTAVACHWIRGRDHSELLWVVGDGRQFNAEGAVPTNTTASNVLRAEDEATWHHLPLITALAALAALLHDLGKATQAFQDRLRNPGLKERNHYRHEWVSVRVFQAFVGTDDDAGWLQRLAACADVGADGKAFEALWLDHANGRLLQDGLSDAGWSAAQKDAANPFVCLPPLAQAVVWLVLTHHRLPCLPNRQDATAPEGDETEDGRHIFKRFGSRPADVSARLLHGLLARINADWNEPREAASDAQKWAYWQFPHGLPVQELPWRKQAARYARKLLDLAPHYPQGAALHDPFAMHISRMCLMLADHHYSSIEDEARRKPYRNAAYPLHANTAKKDSRQRLMDGRKPPFFNQTLDEHLLGVQAHASLITHSLPTLARSLPALQNHKGLKKRNSNPRFQWQDKAADLAASVRSRAASQGAFIVNMASTGCGKTLGNARIMNALADPALGMRCAFAIGLRTLTLQTGRSFQHDLGLNDEQLAIKVGGAASRALFEYWEQQAEATGSASTQALLDEGGQVLFEGNDHHPLLERLTDDVQVRSLIAAPLLVCTVDHLTPATESLRGGRQIAPMLRLLTGDLVLDEPDDFDMADLPALTRLVHWAGLLGSRVLLSSATLPPALVEGLFRAYRAGRAVFQKHRSDRPHEPIQVCCLWVDEFNRTAVDCAKASDFAATHQNFVAQRNTELSKAQARRLATIVPLPEALQAVGLDKAQRRNGLAQFMLQRAWGLHQASQNHSIDPVSGKRVSFGLIRMANIAPLFDVARAMYAQGAPAPDVRIHLCVYHSQFPLLARSVIEQQLDTVLNRRGADDGADPVFQQPSIRALMDAHPEPDQLFIVLGSPVTEVGRDHDYDWAVVEPSSMRSLIQLAGRVRRHRVAEVQVVNVEVLDTNLRALDQPGKAAYCQPGFEMERMAAGGTDAATHFHLESHSLGKLLARQLKEWGGAQWPVDARPRVARTTGKLSPSRNWVDLEHARMRDTMLPREADSTVTTAVKRAACLSWYEGDEEGTEGTTQSLWLTGVLPQYQRFRDDPQPRVDVVLLPDEDETQLRLHRVVDGERRGEQLYVCIDESLRTTIPDAQLRPSPQHGVQPWVQVDLLQALQQLAEARDLSLQDCAKRYATASLPESTGGWLWHEALGFAKAVG